MQIITPPPYFSFQACLHFLNRNSLECLHLVDGSKVLKALPTSIGNVLFQVTETPQRDVAIHILSTDSVDSYEEVQAFVRLWMDMDRDLKPFFDLAAQDSLLAPLALAYEGLRMIRIPDLFEALSWAIIGQQINLRFAYTLKGRMVRKWGQVMEFDDQAHWIFPCPTQIASLEVADFLPMQFSRRKAEYLIQVAQLMTAGELSFAHLNTLSFEEGVKHLVAIRGIGPWSAHYVLMKCLGFTQAFPIQDAGLLQAIRSQMNLAEKPDQATIEALSAPWKEWEAYATFYLWRSLLQ